MVGHRTIKRQVMQDDKLCGQALEYVEKVEMPPSFIPHPHVACAIPFARIHCLSAFEPAMNKNKAVQQTISSKYRIHPVINKTNAGKPYYDLSV
jgi:hypothetical protein